MPNKIAFVGLGNMGAPMAANLLKAGYTLTAYDLIAEAARRLLDQGAAPAESVAAAVAGADVVISMLPAGPHVKGLYLGNGGVLAHAEKDTLLIDCSTIDAASARTVAQTAAEAGFDMLDAPVSGGVAGAGAGTLTFIVGGAVPALKRARPLFEAMGKNVFHAGPAGAGQVAKMCNNMLLGVLMTATSEAINLGVAQGLDPEVLSEIMKASSGGNWALNVYNPYPGVMENAPASKGYEGGFGVDLMLKDLGLAMDAAVHSKVATPLGALARNLYALHSAHGAGKLDFSSIIRFLKAADAS